MPEVSSSLCLHKGFRVYVKELHHFVDAFIVRISFEEGSVLAVNLAVILSIVFSLRAIVLVYLRNSVSNEF